ncbi:hypothetical protein LEP1GSC105_1156 [Leptospira interrogans str. UI 12758]|uniref:Uncharacterized protein n=1 Tax=Leptospira interrogans str. UI 12758 TaxID=1049938 RepID=A0A0E2D1V1_LEPIR|nr:hypothetical protein LEP1GSC105_1156 [Leptospira interrogans str. UI 12758]
MCEFEGRVELYKLFCGGSVPLSGAKVSARPLSGKFFRVIPGPKFYKIQ